MSVGANVYAAGGRSNFCVENSIFALDTAAGSVVALRYGQPYERAT